MIPFRRDGRFFPGVAGRQWAPAAVTGPFQPFVLTPGFGVFRPGFIPFSAGSTPFTGRSDFAQRMFEKTQSILFKRDLPRTGHTFSSVEGSFKATDPHSARKPIRSHRDLKRMKGGKLVFSDYGGRIVRGLPVGPGKRR